MIYPTFDEDKGIHFPTKFASKDDHLYYSIFLGTLYADVEHKKANGECVKQLIQRMRYMRRYTAAFQKEVEAFLQKYNIQRKKFDEQTIDDYLHITENITDFGFRLYSREKVDLYYKVAQEVHKEEERMVYIALFDGSFNIFTPNRKTTGTLWCTKCHGPYLRIARHICTRSCPRCNRLECDSGNPNPDSYRCIDCNFIFNTRSCYEAHLLPKARKTAKVSTCSVLKKCLKCSRVYRQEQKNFVHQCALDKFCNLCKQRVSSIKHDCCWLPVSEKKKNDMIKKQQKWRLVIFDTETVIVNANGAFIEQYVNCLAFSCLCNECLEYPPEQACSGCGVRRKGYFAHKAGESKSVVIDAFLDMLWHDSRFANAICISHNGARFDELFILNRLLQTGHSPEVIMRGSAILLMDLHSPNRNRLIFKDSYLFLPVALDKLPSMFSLSTNIKKGTYPYYYNMPENYDKKLLTLPDAKYYGTAYMTKDKYDNFMKWYQENHNSPFHAKKELREYCETDTMILHLAISRFIQLIMGLYQLNPLIHNATLPSFAFTLIKGRYEKSQIAILPERGFSKFNQSPLAIREFQWMEAKQNRKLQYALKGGEFPVTISGHNYMCDGFDLETGNVIEILGCWFHGCDTCFTSSNPTPMRKNTTFGDLLNETMERIHKIEKCGYKVEIIWEHTIRAELKRNKEKRDFFASREHLLPMSIRDCFIGGRTQPRLLRCTADLEKGEALLHLDVNSLYPACMMKFEFPEGSPDVLTNYEDVEVFLPLKFKGFAKVVLLPPRDLFHPIIPIISKEGKQIYTLCKACSDMKNNEDCFHENIADRVIIVSVFSKELELAMQNGYRCMRLLETYDYNRWTKNLFPPFLKLLQKVKMENSGWAPDILTREQKQDFVAQVLREEGIELDIDAICENKPLRTVAKFICNASFGKLAQKADTTMVKFIHRNNDEVIPFMFDESKVITGQKIVGDNYMITYRLKTEVITPHQYTNVSLAAIITSHGRQILWNAMNRVGTSVAYYDTGIKIHIKIHQRNLDSLIFKAWPGSEQLKDLQGDFLGECYSTPNVHDTVGRWSVDHDSDFEIFDFVACASKVYAYKMKSKTTGLVREIVKCKGVTLDNTSSQIINFDSLALLVDNYLAGDGTSNLTTTRPLITKNPKSVATVMRSKRLRVVMDKLRTLPDGSTLPFGFIRGATPTSSSSSSSQQDQPSTSRDTFDQ